MKQYQDVLLVIRQTGSADAKRNRLIKIQVLTEDEQLAALLDRYIESLRWYMKPGYIRLGAPEGKPKNHAQWVEFNAPREDELRCYVENILAKAKPQWQIIAERNGWAKKEPPTGRQFGCTFDE